MSFIDSNLKNVHKLATSTVLDFMKLDITKTNIKNNNYSGLPFEIHFLKHIKEGHSCLTLLNPLTQGEKRKRCNPKSDYRILASDGFLKISH